MEDFIRDELYNFLNNTDCEEYCKLNDDDIEDIVNNTIDDVMNDNELNSVITYTIKWYVDHYIYNSDLYYKVKEKEEV